LLLFADDGLHLDPKAGIARYGPRSWTASGRHPVRLRVGLIGTAETVETARTWMNNRAEGVAGDENNPEFPGWMPDRGSSPRWNSTTRGTKSLARPNCATYWRSKPRRIASRPP
jgi:hypothetical protein